MKVGGMMRLAQIDEAKLGFDLIHLSITEMAKWCKCIYFLQIGNISQITFDFISNLECDVVITKSETDYLSGWMFQNNESLDDLYQSIPLIYDWIIYPDADDLLPENLLELLDTDADVIRFHFIECVGSTEQIIAVKEGFPIGPHFKAIRQKDDVTFRGGDGFNEPTTTTARKLIRYETDYCMRHLRYANPKGVEERKKMNYFQQYFLDEHELIEYKPQQTFNYYRR